MKKILLITVLSLLSVSFASAQTIQEHPQVITTPSLTAKLVDPEKNAAMKTAIVEVTVTGIKLIDPAVGTGSKNEGHLH